MIDIKCVNCGAELHGNICEYCGTRYSNKGVTASFNEKDYTGIITIGQQIYKAYVRSVDYEDPTPSVGRTVDGRITVPKRIIKRIFTLVEI